jgi:exodeoxyribonuclease V beta subunit
MQPADVTGPLPTGTSVLEASAGTGKTWTIAALVARYLAEGRCRVEELLVVTFGRAATSDLRSRVRERLLSVHAGLGDPSDDPVVTLLNGGDVELRRRRLATALAAFDSATVTTTHSFCDQVLRSLGVLGRPRPRHAARREPRRAAGGGGRRRLPLAGDRARRAALRAVDGPRGGPQGAR